jgi:hypothetical protein
VKSKKVTALQQAKSKRVSSFSKSEIKKNKQLFNEQNQKQ